jgi:hypothetical protein
MRIQNGSPKAMQLFNRLKNEGTLVDLYSKEVFDKNHNGPAIYLEDFERIIEIENGKNDDYGNEKFPLGHLLVICSALLRHEDKKLLGKIYAPLINVFRNGIHHPDFLIFNLYTKQILYVGLGRKNRLFCIDVGSDKNIDPLHYVAGSEDYQYMQKFTEHDVIDFVEEDLVGSLYSMGLAFFEQDHLPFIDDLHNLLDTEPNGDGMYELEGYDDGVSAQEVKEMINEYEDHQKTITHSLQILQSFFPELTEGDLNTGDY